MYSMRAYPVQRPVKDVAAKMAGMRSRVRMFVVFTALTCLWIWPNNRTKRSAFDPFDAVAMFQSAYQALKCRMYVCRRVEESESIKTTQRNKTQSSAIKKMWTTSHKMHSVLCYVRSVLKRDKRAKFRRVRTRNRQHDVSPLNLADVVHRRIPHLSHSHTCMMRNVCSRITEIG